MIRWMCESRGGRRDDGCTDRWTNPRGTAAGAWLGWRAAGGPGCAEPGAGPGGCCAHRQRGSRRRAAGPDDGPDGLQELLYHIPHQRQPGRPALQRFALHCTSPPPGAAGHRYSTLIITKSTNSRKTREICALKSKRVLTVYFHGRRVHHINNNNNTYFKNYFCVNLTR